MGVVILIRPEPRLETLLVKPVSLCYNVCVTDVHWGLSSEVTSLLLETTSPHPTGSVTVLSTTRHPAKPTPSAPEPLRRGKGRFPAGPCFGRPRGAAFFPAPAASAQNFGRICPFKLLTRRKTPPPETRRRAAEEMMTFSDNGDGAPFSL